MSHADDCGISACVRNSAGDCRDGLTPDETGFMRCTQEYQHSGGDGMSHADDCAVQFDARQACTCGAGEMTAKALVRHPHFGEHVHNISAGESNPRRDGIFVRVVRVTGKMNPGTWYECTDGKGSFWQSDPRSLIVLSKATP
jgi:hypothetical protein